MSNRPCNWCNYNALVRDAKANGKRIVKRPSTGILGGVDLYRVKPREAPSKRNWIAWMMALPNECHC